MKRTVIRLRTRIFAGLTLTPSIALICAVALLLAGVLVGLYEEQLYRLEKVQEIRVQGEILADSITAALVFNDTKAAQEFVSALAADPAMEAAGVYDAKGGRIAGFARPGVAPLPAKGSVAAPYFADNHVYAAMPVMQDNAVVGSVFLRASTDSLQRRLIRYGGIVLLVTMGMLVLAVLGQAQNALARANAELESQAHDLALSNRRLLAEMEERERAEEALRQSQKMEAIGQLSGGIAHDFNNLLTIVRGNLQLLQRRIAQGRGDTQRYIDAAMEGLARAASVTQRILAFSRRQPLSPKPVDLSGLVGGMADLLRHSVGPNIEIETRLKADWWTLCDANQMENVILNLTINARDAMAGGGRLEIEVANVRVSGTAEIAAGDYVKLVVRDTGAGMSEEVKRRAIDPFFTTKPQGQGTGLGLSMTFGFVRQSNGYLDIASEVGKGTAITILMPRYESQPMPPGSVT